MSLANAEYEAAVTAAIQRRRLGLQEEPYPPRRRAFTVFFTGPGVSRFNGLRGGGLLSIHVGPQSMYIPGAPGMHLQTRYVQGWLYDTPTRFGSHRVADTIYDIMRVISVIKAEFRAHMKLGDRAVLRVVDAPDLGRLARLSSEDVTADEVEKQIPIWRKKRENAARAIQKRWLPAYYNPRSRIGKARLYDE